MDRRRASLVFLLTVLGFLYLPFGWSATATIDAKIISILSHETDLGKCMIALSSDPMDSLPLCGADWVTLDCDDAVYVSNAVSNRSMEMALLALDKDLRVRAYIDDARQIDGYCLAFRIDIRRPPLPLDI